MSPFGLALAVLGLAQAGIAALRPDLPTLERGLAGWSGVSFGVAGLAYGPLGPRVFGKRHDGTLAPTRVALLWPYFLATWLLCTLYRVGKPWHEVAPGIFLGRRLAHGDSLPDGVGAIVDLTAELVEPRTVRDGRIYRCLPTADGHIPDFARFRALVAEAAAWTEPIYIHCAQGQGRGALFAAALLLERGLARNAEDAVARLKAARPSVSLRLAQRALLERYDGR